MPDRVKLPRGVGWQYGVICRCLDEFQRPDSVAPLIVQRLKKDIRSRGQGGIQLIKSFSPTLAILNDPNSLLRRLREEFVKAHKLIRQLANNLREGDLLFTEQASQACRTLLIRVEQNVITQPVEQQLMNEFMLNIWRSQVKDPMLLDVSEQAYDLYDSYYSEVEDNIGSLLKGNSEVSPTIDDTLEANILDL